MNSTVKQIIGFLSIILWGVLFAALLNISFLAAAILVVAIQLQQGLVMVAVLQTIFDGTKK